MSVILMKQLLEAGVHFGHQTRKWNPKMAKYIFTSRNDIHVINLEQTVDLIDKAYAYIRDNVKAGKSVIFVGTKKQAQDTIKEEAEKCGMFYVNSRWLGGTLTNFKQIRSRVDRLVRLEQMEKTGELDLLPKKEVMGLRAEREKLYTHLNGIREMNRLPGIMFVVDSKKEYIAVKEARDLGIPVVGLIDTNCNPDVLDVVIPANDDAIRSIKLIVSAMADAVIEAREGEEGLKARKEAQKQADVVVPVEEQSVDGMEELLKKDTKVKEPKILVEKEIEKKEVEKVEKKEAIKAEVVKPEVVKAEVVKPEVVKAEVVKAEVVKAEVVKEIVAEEKPKAKRVKKEKVESAEKEVAVKEEKEEKPAKKTSAKTKVKSAEEKPAKKATEEKPAKKTTKKSA